MKKQLLTSLLSLFLVAGFAPMSISASTGSSSCCSGSSDCPMDKDSSCSYKVLTKEECQRFCKAKATAIAKDPSLAKPENKCKLCRAIVKADPSMKPICMKLRKNCRKMKKHCISSGCDQTSQKSADAGNSSSLMSSSVAAHAASASGDQSQSSSASSAN